jgi:hypothetical protein
MHDREFIKPAPLKLRLPAQPKDSPDIEYSFASYLGEHVWSYQKWNTDDGWDEAQIRIGDAVDAAADGGIVLIDTIDDFEKLREANKAADIKGNFAPKIRKMQRAIKSATRPVVQAANGAGVEDISARSHG